VAPQALEHILEGPAPEAALSALLVCLPQHAAAILKHKRLDSSCQSFSGSETRSTDASASRAMLHALNSMAAAASYGQIAGSSAGRQKALLLLSAACVTLLSTCTH
jgi:hypothetical protein